MSPSEYDFRQKIPDQYERAILPVWQVPVVFNDQIISHTNIPTDGIALLNLPDEVVKKLDTGVLIICTFGTILGQGNRNQKEVEQIDSIDIEFAG